MQARNKDETETIVAATPFCRFEWEVIRCRYMQMRASLIFQLLRIVFTEMHYLDQVLSVEASGERRISE
jgi:hypothetical protein